MVLKGPALAEQVYGGLARRQFCDLDLLVPREDVPTARTVLMQSGFHRELGFTKVQERSLLRTGYHDYFRNDSGTVVELHWRLGSAALPCALTFEELWQSREEVCIAGRDVFALCRQHLLLTLCIHGSKHAWERLEWICGVAELMRRPELPDYDLLLNDATRLRNRRAILVGVLLASSLLEVDVPTTVQKALNAEGRTSRLVSDLIRQLFRSHQPSLFYPLFQLRSRDSNTEILRLLLTGAFLPTTEDWSAFRLPDRLNALYYLLRPVRLLSKYALRPVRLFSSSPQT